MKRANDSFPEKEKILKLLDIKENDHEAITTHYQQKQKMLYSRLKAATDIKERIKVQNILLELDDAFIEYQSGINGMS